jgi:hypothetical protein
LHPKAEGQPTHDLLSVARRYTQQSPARAHERVREFARLARSAGATPIALDVRDLEPSPTGFLKGLRAALNIDATGSPFEALAIRSNRCC